MKAKMFLVLAAAFVALLLPSGASACGAGEIALLNNNVGGQGIEVCITIATGGGNTTITLVSVNNVPAVYGSFQKVFDTAWNGTSSNVFISSGPTGGWVAQTPDNGLGGFNAFVINGAASAGQPFSVIGQSWVVSGTGITIVAMHIGFANGCTFVVSNGGTGSNTGGLSGACTAIPEPGTMALFGSGLVGLAGILRRRLGWA